MHNSMLKVWTDSYYLDKSIHILLSNLYNYRNSTYITYKWNHSILETLIFTKPLEDQTCFEFDSCALTCTLSNHKTPVKWLKNGVEIESSDGIKITSEKGVHTLTIKSSTLEDEAEYTVKADNVESCCTVLVEGTSLCQALLIISL